MKMPLAVAHKYAEQIVSQISPFCSRVEIAGSIRRRRPMVNDIDIVCIATDWEGLQKRCLEKCTSTTRADSNFSITTRTGIQIDIFRARATEKDSVQTVPGNWGSIMVCRTGSKEHNIMIASRAKAMGLHWNPYVGVCGRNFDPIAYETEEDIFEALQLKYVPPEQRELAGGAAK